MSGDEAGQRASRRWVVCADDFALDRGAIEATLALIELGRVTATSALVDAPDWKAAALDLKAVSDRADIGLHLNLTEALQPEASAWSLPSLVVGSLLRWVPRRRVRDAVERQLDAFTDAFERMPDFIDGHHHVHQLPVVREQLIEAVRVREPSSPPWLRICATGAGETDRKARVIEMLGAASLRQLARQAGLPCSLCLVGVYGFDLSRDAYLARLRQWLQSGPEGTVLMCHPSTGSSGKDPIGAARRMELGVLSGDAYAQALAAAGVTAVRGSTLLGAAPPSPQAARSDSRIN